MSNGKNPLVLMMALTMPGAAHALGLGDIHVDSALNEPLSAEIDIIGATAAELADLRASVANRETFLRYGAERPAFLASATFKVAHDGRGRPILAVRSTEAFLEPVVNFLVDLRWHKGEVVRQYTLLLDPPGFGSANRAVEVATLPAPSATPLLQIPTAARQVAPPRGRPERNTAQIKVGARATLRGIAWRVGARSEPGLKKTMLAIFRANPAAFDNNINRLHLGAVLTIPSYEEVEAIADGEAKREIHSQMAAWHSPPKPVAAKQAVAPPLTRPSAAQSPSLAADSALDDRIHSLEQELGAMKSALAGEQSRIDELQHREAQAPVAPAAQSVPASDAMADLEQTPDETAADPQPPIVAAQPIVVAASKPPAVDAHYSTMVPALAGVGLLAAALAALYGRLRRRVSKPSTPGAAVQAVPMEQTQTLAEASEPPPEMINEERTMTAAVDEATEPLLPLVPHADAAGRTEGTTAAVSRLDPEDFTVKLRMDPAMDDEKVAVTRLDYNLVDLDLTAQHVQMPSVLNEHAVVKERRTNLADVLKLAIEREPDRHDLRMKLLELYYAAAATNRQGFLEVVQKFARERHHLQDGEWDKIAFMGRQIASESPLFAEAAGEGDELADCA